MSDERSRLQQIGCQISGAVADFAANPLAQVGFLVVCIAWFLFGWNVNILTASLSILAITLTQMVLNSQQERERDAHRRDVALHAKLDELLRASRRARDELAGIEELEVEDIEELKEATPHHDQDAPGGRGGTERDISPPGRGGPSRSA
jgi:low affinity Fe/Cu permease